MVTKLFLKNMPNNIFYTSLKYVIINLIGDILYWPIWWYSKGLIKTGLFCLNAIKQQEERLAVGIWIKNIFTPMFGQDDIEGRLISFFARIIQIIARAIVLVIWVVYYLALFLVWLIAPIFIVYQIATNFIWLVK